MKAQSDRLSCKYKSLAVTCVFTLLALSFFLAFGLMGMWMEKDVVAGNGGVWIYGSLTMLAVLSSLYFLPKISKFFHSWHRAKVLQIQTLLLGFVSGLAIAYFLFTHGDGTVVWWKEYLVDLLAIIGGLHLAIAGITHLLGLWFPGEEPSVSTMPQETESNGG